MQAKVAPRGSLFAAAQRSARHSARERCNEQPERHAKCDLADSRGVRRARGRTCRNAEHEQDREYEDVSEHALARTAGRFRAALSWAGGVFWTIRRALKVP